MASADAVVIGAGAGMSTAAGFTYTGKRFREFFSDFIDKYNFSDMYSGGFHHFASQEEHWAYWSRYIYCNRYLDPPKSTYSELFELVKNKDYFVITTNVDHCFQKAGFDKERLFYTQGDYGLFQCSEPCHYDTYDNESVIMAMVREQRAMLVPTELLPKCPKCGKPMTMNLRSDNRFVEDAGWCIACGRYEDFLKAHEGGRVLFLELGVGFNTPGIIKYPFWRMALANSNAVYAALNKSDSLAPAEIQDRSICIDEDIDKVLAALK